METEQLIATTLDQLQASRANYFADIRANYAQYFSDMHSAIEKSFGPLLARLEQQAQEQEKEHRSMQEQQYLQEVSNPVPPPLQIATKSPPWVTLEAHPTTTANPQTPATQPYLPKSPITPNGSAQKLAQISAGLVGYSGEPPVVTDGLQGLRSEPPSSPSGSPVIERDGDFKPPRQSSPPPLQTVVEPQPEPPDESHPRLQLAANDESPPPLQITQPPPANQRRSKRHRRPPRPSEPPS